MKKIAVLTSGGDAPGMNAAIRAAIRWGWEKNYEMFGIYDGFSGLLSSLIKPLSIRDVGGIIHQGGTCLGSSRCPEFHSEEGQKKGISNLQKAGIEGLIVIGGNGSQAGALALHRRGLPVMGIASTIDNDLFGTDISLGVDTALNIALESIDRLRVTASSHHRVMLVEVMGRNSGYLGLMAGIAGGAEVILIPEIKVEPDQVEEQILQCYRQGKRHALVVIAEGAAYPAQRLYEHFHDHKKDLKFDLRVTILGHVQRGGVPSHFDRLLGTRLGVAAMESLDQGKWGNLVGVINGSISLTPLEMAVGKIKELPQEYLKMALVLAK